MIYTAVNHWFTEQKSLTPKVSPTDMRRIHVNKRFTPVNCLSTPVNCQFTPVNHVNWQFTGVNQWFIYQNSMRYEYVVLRNERPIKVWITV